jgi:hypothetical protein
MMMQGFEPRWTNDLNADALQSIMLFTITITIQFQISFLL